MRVAVDGHLLAANEAALALFGAQELADVVGHSLVDRIAASSLAEWSGFAERVWDEGPGSTECVVVTVPGAQKSVLFQAVPLPGHPDEIRSILLTVRDLSTSHRLETALEHHDVEPTRDLRAELAQAVAELDTLRAERGRADAALADHAAHQQRLATEHASEVARLSQTLVEHHQLTTILTNRGNEARAEQQRLAALLEQREGELGRLVADRTGERDRVQKALVSEKARSQTLERDARELDAARAEWQRTAVLIDEREAEFKRLIAERTAERDRLQRAIADEQARGQTLERDAREVDAARAEQQRLAALLEQRDAELEQRDAEREQRDAELKQRDAEREQRDAESRRLIAEHEAEHARLQQAIADEHDRAEALEREARELDGVRAQLAGAAAEKAELKASLERRDTEYQQLVTEQALERAQVQQAAAAERDRALAFEQQAKQLADERTKLEASFDATSADTSDLKALLQQHEKALKDLRSKLVNAAGERTRLDTLLKQRGAEAQRLAKERAAERATYDQAREEAVRQHAEIVKALADQKLELQILTENMRKVEPLAAAGRLAAEVHRELQTSLAQIEQGAGRLIERSSLEAIDRGEIEKLRIETARAALLARQVVPAKTQA